MKTTLKFKASYAGALLLLAGLLLLGCSGLRAWVVCEGYFEKGNAAYRAGSYGDAEVWYHKALGAGAKLGIGQYNLGNALYQQGRYAEAAQCYQQARRANAPGLPTQTWVNLGNAYYQAGQVQASYAAYRSALLSSPADALIRQDFLLVQAQLAAKPKEPAPQKAPEKPAAPGPKKTAESQRKGATPKENTSAAQPAAPAEQQLSAKNMQALFGTITQDESRLRAKLNDARPQKRKAVSDEKDY